MVRLKNPFRSKKISTCVVNEDRGMFDDILNLVNKEITSHIEVASDASCLIYGYYTEDKIFLLQIKNQIFLNL